MSQNSRKSSSPQEQSAILDFFASESQTENSVVQMNVQTSQTGAQAQYSSEHVKAPGSDAQEQYGDRAHLMYVPQMFQQATVLTQQTPVTLQNQMHDIQSTISADSTDQILYVPLRSTEQCQLVRVAEIESLQPSVSEEQQSISQSHPSDMRGQSPTGDRLPVTTTK